MSNKLFFILILLLSATSCEQSQDWDGDKDNYKANKLGIEVSADKLEFTTGVSVMHFTVKSQCPFVVNILNDASWLMTSMASKKNETEVSVSVQENPSTQSTRLARICVTDGMNEHFIEVSQAPGTEVIIAKPTVANFTVADITKTTAVCYFNYFSANVEVIEAGICYSKDNGQNTLTVDNSESMLIHPNTKNGNASFTLKDLQQDTRYAVCPYLRTDTDIVYGDIMIFTTLKSNIPDEGDNPTPEY